MKPHEDSIHWVVIPPSPNDRIAPTAERARQSGGPNRTNQPQQEPTWDGNTEHLIAYGRDYGYLHDQPDIAVERRLLRHE
jgi:hypothetical protein